MIGLYVHIPFCRTLCPYCDFTHQPLAGPVPEVFMKALCTEMASFQGPATANTVFLGGGTPSLLAPADVRRILASLRDRFRLADAAEITIEANADDVTDDLAPRLG